MLLIYSPGSLEKAREGHPLAVANKEHFLPATKGHAVQVNTLQMSILPVNASCGAILITCNGRAGLLHGHQRAPVNPTRRYQAP